MLEITEGQMIAIAADARARLRPTLLQHWFEGMRTSGDVVGPDLREQVIREVEELAAGDPELDLADLMMIADLRLVSIAGEVRRARTPH
jgi:hypothetical protein